MTTKSAIGKLAAVTALTCIGVGHADDLAHTPETFNERWAIAVFCDASLAARVSDADLARIAAWIAKHKPDLDCARERAPTLVDPDAKEKKH